MNEYGPLSLRMHAINDLVGLSLLLVSPWLLGFSDYAAATGFTVALVAVGTTLNLLTDYPLGLIKKVPFKRHKLVELTSPPIFIGIPWYFFSDAGLMPWATSTIGVLALVNALLTKARPA